MLHVALLKVAHANVRSTKISEDGRTVAVLVIEIAEGECTSQLKLLSVEH